MRSPSMRARVRTALRIQKSGSGVKLCIHFVVTSSIFIVKVEEPSSFTVKFDVQLIKLIYHKVIFKSTHFVPTKIRYTTAIIMNSCHYYRNSDRIIYVEIKITHQYKVCITL